MKLQEADSGKTKENCTVEGRSEKNIKDGSDVLLGCCISLYYFYILSWYSKFLFLEGFEGLLSFR